MPNQVFGAAKGNLRSRRSSIHKQPLLPKIAFAYLFGRPDRPLPDNILTYPQ